MMGRHQVLEYLTYLRRLKSKQFYRIWHLAQILLVIISYGMVLNMVHIVKKPSKETFPRLVDTKLVYALVNTLAQIKKYSRHLSRAFHRTVLMNFRQNTIKLRWMANFISVTVLPKILYYWWCTFLFNGRKWYVRSILFKKIYLNKY